jgi:hypothetical protein
LGDGDGGEEAQNGKERVERAECEVTRSIIPQKRIKSSVDFTQWLGLGRRLKTKRLIRVVLV